MPEPDDLPLNHPELTDPLRRGEEKIARLMAAQPRAFAAGETIIPQGTEHDFVYRLRTGWAGRVRTLPDGRSQYILVFLPGDIFAVKSMFYTLHPDTVVALSDVTLEQIDRRKLKAAFDADPDIATRCTFQVLEEERRLHNWVVGLGQGNADERMAHMLLEFRGRLIRAGVIEAPGDGFRLPMTQDQLGGFLGITPVHVSRVLRRFREEEIAVIRGGAAKILNMPALARIAYPVQDPFERDGPESHQDAAPR